MLETIKRILRRWFYTYRNENTGQFISKAEYDRLPPEDRMRHRHERQR